MDKMNPKGKRVFMNSIIVIAVMLFIFGYFIGKTHEETEQKLNNETKIENKKGFSYSNLNNGLETYTDHSTDKKMDDTAGIDPFTDFDPNAERKVNILADFYSPEQINAAKNAAELFIQNFHPFDGEQPTQHIEKAIPYVTEELKNKITGQIIRPTSSFYTRNIIKLEIYEPYNPSGEDMLLNARVEADIFDSKGELVNRQIVDYEMKLIWIQDTFKVSEYTYATLSRGDGEYAE